MPAGVRTSTKKLAKAAPKSSRGRQSLKLPPGFKDLGPIASGAFSTIVKARHVESGAVLAVKEFKCKTDVDEAERDRELAVLRLVSAAGHAHIANLLDEDVLDGSHLAYLFYCGGGSLHAHLTKLRKKQLAMNETNSVVVTAQISSALQHCHALGVAHRDVKPANVLYDGRRWRLCDFGFAVEAGERKMKEQLGSLVYCAPEILSGKSAYTGWAVDMWALGAMVYEMRVGRTCFAAADEGTLRLRIANGFKGGTEGFPWMPAMSVECRALISALLVKAPPESRLRAQQVLEHDWVRAHCTPGGGGGGGEGDGGGGEATIDPAAGGGAQNGADVFHFADDDGGDAGADAAVGNGGTADAGIVAACAAPVAADDDDSAEEDNEDLSADNDVGQQQPHWWCDVAAEGCVRPEQPTHEAQYDAHDRCWAHPNGVYVVCQACYASGQAEHMDVLSLVDSYA